MSRTEFACAADYFGAVRAAAIDAERIGRRLERMAAREGVRAQGYEAQGRGTRSDVNGTDATVGRMDWEGRIAARREGDYKLIDSACEVIYGNDQTGMGGTRRSWARPPPTPSGGASAARPSGARWPSAWR